jgi:quercetin dioxygenase-like cupin family protein
MFVASEVFQANFALRNGDNMHRLFALLLNLILFAAFGSEPVKTPQAWDAKSIAWQKIDPDGSKWAVLQGRSDVEGEAFTYAAFVPAGFHDFHAHGADARVAVVQGVLKVSFGESLDLEHLKSYPIGTFLYVPANVKHTMAADEDTIIIGTAAGPWHTDHPGGHQHQ